MIRPLLPATDGLVKEKVFEPVQPRRPLMLFYPRTVMASVALLMESNSCKAHKMNSEFVTK